MVRVGPGLLALLEHPIAGGRAALGAGYHARYNVPLGLAISAALALVEPVTPEGIWWVGREATVEWLGRPALDDTLVGEARLTALSERDAVFAITARSEGGAELLRGQFMLVRTVGGHAVGYPSVSGSGGAASLSEHASARRAATGAAAVAAGTVGDPERAGTGETPEPGERGEPAQPDLFRLRPPSAGATAGSCRVPPDVVRLLMNPLAGHGEPLGRRVHPLAGLSLGASLTAAFGIAGEPAPAEPARARAVAQWIRWLAPPDLEADLEARARVASTAGDALTIAVEVFNGGGPRASQSEIVVADSLTEPHAASAALVARRTIERGPATPAVPGSPLSRAAARLTGLWHRLRFS